jgi:hypothetical protein
VGWLIICGVEGGVSYIVMKKKEGVVWTVESAGVIVYI